MKRFKILQLQLHSYSHIPSSDLSEQISRALPADEFEVTSAFFQGEFPARSPDSVGNIKCFGFSSASLKGLRRWLVTYRLYRYCKQEKFDLIICHRFKPIHMIMRINKWLRTPVPAIGIIHGIGDFNRKYRRKIMQKSLTDLWTMVGVSGSVRDYLTGLQCGMTNLNTVAINNAIDIDAAVKMQLSKDEALAKLKLPTGKLVFGTIGRLVPVKGHIYLLEAFNKIKNDVSDAIVVIIGEGRERSRLEAYIDEHDLQDSVFLVGAQDNAIQYLKAYDIFVLPSLSEGLPLALLEAMSASLTVMGSDIPAIRPVIEKVGFLFKVKDPESLADKMLELAQIDRDVIGQQAFSHLQECHDVSDFQIRYEKLIRKMLA